MGILPQEYYEELLQLTCPHVNVIEVYKDTSGEIKFIHLLKTKDFRKFVLTKKLLLDENSLVKVYAPIGFDTNIKADVSVSQKLLLSHILFKFVALFVYFLWSWNSRIRHCVMWINTIWVSFIINAPSLQRNTQNA